MRGGARAVKNAWRKLPCGLLTVVLLTGLAGCSPRPQQPVGPRPSLAIVNVALLDPGSGIESAGSQVLITEGRISYVGLGVAVPDGVQVVDGTGLYLLPGLWDLHTHLSLLDDSVPPLLVTQGVTGVRDLGGHLDGVEALRGRIESGELLGPRILYAGPTLNGAPNAAFHRVIDSPAAASAVVSELRQAGVDFLKTHNATESEVYFALLEHAAQAGLAVAGHVPLQVSPLEACRAGQASVEHIATLFEGKYIAGFASELEAFLALPAWVESEAQPLVACFAERQTLFVPTLRAYEVRAERAALYDAPDPRWRYVSSALYERWRDQGPPSETDRNPQVIELRGSLVEVGQSMVSRSSRAGAPVGVGTDLGVGILPGYDLHREIELFAGAGLTPRQALEAATRGPGTRFGADSLTGRLVEGAPADLVLLRGNAFDDLSALRTIEAVILNGRLLNRGSLDQTLGDLEAAGPQGTALNL